jgi:large subunit ribosomal protein L23
MTTNDPRHYDVIIAPLITEKATNASEFNKVVFKVAMTATKPQIKEAVEKRRRGKWKPFRGRYGQTSDTKRAIVTLEEGQKIDVTTGL